MAHPAISAMFRKVQVEEILPHVDAVPGTTPADYLTLIERRFSNPAIRDTTRRVAFDGSSRHTGFVLPILHDALAAGGPLEGLALVEALWARMCDGHREDGSEIAPNDPHWAQLTAAAQAARIEPRVWLDQRWVYGRLGEAGEFAEAFERWLSTIWRTGTVGALAAYASGQ
jgi:mannitol 2-dehydrogenase